MGSGLCLIFTLIVFELTLAAVGSSMGESATDVPQYNSNIQHIVTIELSNANISDDQRMPAAKTNMSGAYIVSATRQSTNYCSENIEKSIESFNSERYQEAMDFLNKTIEICPYFADAWYKRGYIEFQLMRYDEALYDFSMATELDKTDANYWAFKGIVLYIKERHYEALAALDCSLDINPDNSYSREWKEIVLKSIKENK